MEERKKRKEKKEESLVTISGSWGQSAGVLLRLGRRWAKEGAGVPWGPWEEMHWDL